MESQPCSEELPVKDEEDSPQAEFDDLERDALAFSQGVRCFCLDVTFGFDSGADN